LQISRVTNTNAIIPDELEIASFRDSPLHMPCLSPSHSTCPSQTGEGREGMAVKEEEWREGKFSEG